MLILRGFVSPVDENGTPFCKRLNLNSIKEISLNVLSRIVEKIINGLHVS
jgi:hypothetical protein